MHDINLYYDKKFMTNYGYPLYIFELQQFLNIYPCVKCVKIGYLFISKKQQQKKQNRKYENVFAK